MTRAGAAPPGTPRPWGLDVFWGSTPGSVRFRDVCSGEWVEVEGTYLRASNPKTDLRWMARRAAHRERRPEKGGRAHGEHPVRA